MKSRSGAYGSGWTEEILRRPALVLAIALVVGLSSQRFPYHLVALFPLFWFARTNRAWVLVGAVVGVLLAPPAWSLELREPVYVDGPVRVLGFASLADDRQVALGEAFGRRIWIRAPADPPLVPGTRLTVRGMLEPVSEAREPAAQRDRVTGTLQVHAEQMQILDPGPWIWRQAAAWRMNFVGFTRRSLSLESARLVEAMTFSLGGQLTPAQVRALERSGTLHVISASGLHVTVLAGAVGFLLSLLPFPRYVQVLVAVLLLIFYAAAAEMATPIVRAILMAAIGWSAYLFRRTPDLLSAIGVAAVLSLLWRPGEVFAVPFHLSFLAVIGIALALETHPTGWRVVAAVPVAAIVATMPLVAWAFGTVSVVGLPANLLTSIVVPAILVVSLVAQLLEWISSPLSQLLMGCVEFWMTFFSWIVESLGGRGSVVRAPGFSAYWLIPIYGALLALGRRRDRRA